MQCDTLAAERDADRRELDRLRQHNPDDLYIPQIKEVFLVWFKLRSASRKQAGTSGSHLSHLPARPSV